MDRIFRYQNVANVRTPLDPLPDVIAWVRGLKSIDYTEEILHLIHECPKEIRTESAKEISALAENAVRFLDQGFSSAPEMAFLPLYYALLDLAKAAIIAGGKKKDLDQQRGHGVRWTRKVPSDNPVDDYIQLGKNGEIPLFYNLLTHDHWPKGPLQMRDVYPYIYATGHEFHMSFGQDRYFDPTRLERFFEPIEVLVESENDTVRMIEIRFTAATRPLAKKKYPILKGFTREQEGIYALKLDNGESESESQAPLLNKLRRYLLYDMFERREIKRGVNIGIPLDHWVSYHATYTPISTNPLQLPEEIPLILTFFHLSSIVRYHPERLNEYFNSQAGAFLEALIRQGTYRFLLCFWSFMNQTTHLILD
jgi:hypothetical protein